MMELPINKILNGDCLEHLKELPDESVNMVMTSPPYFNQRDYGVDGQIGLEESPEKYIIKLCNVFDEVKRILRKDGTCWVNISDCYGGYQGKNNGYPDRKNEVADIPQIKRNPKTAKSLLCVPEMFLLEMIKRGWIIRNKIIWYKNNVMPSSAEDRFTIDWEYLYFFVKNKNYFFEQQFEPHKNPKDVLYRKELRKNKNYLVKKPYTNNVPYSVQPRKKEIEDYKKLKEILDLADNYDYQMTKEFIKSSEKSTYEGGRNKRCVWNINTKPFKESHFAVYPEELVWTPIKAGCPEFVCNKCGKPKNIITDSSERINTRPALNVGNSKSGKDIDPNKELHNSDLSKYRQQIIYKTIGYTDCGCKAGFSSGVVCDPFFGSGTTGVVALKQGKNFIGIELNPDYIKIAEARIKPFLEQRKLEVTN